MSKEINEKLMEMGFCLSCVFVPFSKSRNKYQKHPSLNWLVTLVYNEKPVLTTDYMQGYGFCPSMKRGCGHGKRLPAAECESGFPMREGGLGFTKRSNNRILPDISNFVYSILADSDVLNHSDFSDWASNFGYDDDSIAAKKIYDECMNIALQFSNGIPDKIRDDVAKLLEDF